MTLAAQTTTRSRARLSTVTNDPIAGEESSRIEILENAIQQFDPGLAAAVEDQLRRVLRDDVLGFVTVRFGVCRDDADAFRFICKVENPPRVDTDVMVPWRWWSPMVATADEFAAALADGLRVRRARLGAGTAGGDVIA